MSLIDNIPGGGGGMVWGEETAGNLRSCQGFTLRAIRSPFAVPLCPLTSFQNTVSLFSAAAIHTISLTCLTTFVNPASLSPSGANLISSLSSVTVVRYLTARPKGCLWDKGLQ